MKEQELCAHRRLRLSAAAALVSGLSVGAGGSPPPDLAKRALQVLEEERCRTNTPGISAALAVLVERPYGSFAYGCGTFNSFNACILDDPARDLVAAMTCNKEEVGLRPLERLAGLIRKP